MVIPNPHHRVLEYDSDDISGYSGEYEAVWQFPCGSFYKIEMFPRSGGEIVLIGPYIDQAWLDMLVQELSKLN